MMIELKPKDNGNIRLYIYGRPIMDLLSSDDAIDIKNRITNSMITHGKITRRNFKNQIKNKIIENNDINLLNSLKELL